MNAAFAPVGNEFGRASDWRSACLAFVIVVVVLLVAYASTVASLVHVWAHDGTYQYAFLITPLSVWVAWPLRHRLRAHAPVPSVWGLAAVAALACLWYAGHSLVVNLPQHFALVAMLPALVLACWGWRALWGLAFPLGYLLVFAVPWGDGLVGPLQDLTARMAVHALEWTGSPVLLDGRQIITPTAVWMVEAACSGVKFFIACTALGCLYAYLMYFRAWKRIVFVVLAAVVPIIANGLRVYFTILIGETFGMKYATGTDHLIFGWQFFGTVLLLLLLAGWFFRDRVMARPRPQPERGEAVRSRLVVWPVALVLLLAAPVTAAALTAAVAPPRIDPIAPVLPGWHPVPVPQAGWRPAFHGAAGAVRASYQADAGGVAVGLLHAVYLGRPTRGHRLITFGNAVYDPGRARVLATAERTIEVADGARVTARELRLTGAQGGRLVWYWYAVDGQRTTSPVWAKLLMAWTVLRGQPSRSAVWALSVPIEHGQRQRARATLRAWVHALPTAGSTR